MLEAFGRLGIEMSDDFAEETLPAEVVVEPMPESDHVWPPPGYLLPGPMRAMRNAE